MRPNYFFTTPNIITGGGVSNMKFEGNTQFKSTALSIYGLGHGNQEPLNFHI